MHDSGTGGVSSKLPIHRAMGDANVFHRAHHWEISLFLPRLVV